MSDDSISSYNAALDPKRAAICDRLRTLIDAALPQATSKIWHAIPVWWVGENVVVGYTERKTGVMLMFWNGQRFDEPELEASGSFHMAQIAYEDASQIDELKVARWLGKAGTNIWDFASERRAYAARRKWKAENTPKTRAKAKAKVKAKTKNKAKAVKRTKTKRRAKAK
jgi:hypothetical protein